MNWYRLNLGRLLANRTKLFAFNTATNLFTHFATIIVAIFALPLKLNYFGANIFGIFILVSSLLTYFNKIDFGVGSTLQRYTANLMVLDKTDEIRKLLGFGLLFNTVYGFLTALILLTVGNFADHLFALKYEDYAVFKQLLFLVAIRTTITLPLSIFNTFLAGAQYYFFTNSIKLINIFGDLIVILVIIHYQSSILAYVLFISVIGLLTQCTIAFFALIKFPFAKPCSFQWHEIKGYLSFSVQMLKSQVSSIIQYETDRILISIFLNMQSLTFYHVGERLHAMVRNIFNSFSLSMTPLLTEKHAENDSIYLRRAVYDGSRIISLIWYPVIVALMINTKYILSIWLGSEYSFLHPFASLFLLPYLISVPSVVLNRILIGSGRIKEFMDIRIIGAFMNVTISIILIHYYGIWGVLAGTLCQSILFGIYVYRIYFRYIEVNREEYLVKVIIPSLFTGILTATCGYFLVKLFIPSNLPELFLSVCIPIVTGYLSSIFLFPRDISFIKRLVWTPH